MLKRKILSLLFAVTLCLVSFALNSHPASAASTGSIKSVCLVGNTLYVTINALGDSADNASGDEIGFLANKHPIVWGYIPADKQFHNLTLSVALSSSEVSAPILVDAGDGLNNSPIGLGFSGFGTAVRPACPPDKPLFTDGRINPESQATMVGYCTSDHGITVYTPTGHKLFTASAAQIAAALTQAAKTNTHQIIAQGGGQQLWALKSNELQFHNALGVKYDFVFPANRCQ